VTQPPHGSPEGQPPKKRKKWPFLVGGVILLIIVIAVANGNSGNSNTTTAGATSTATSSTTAARSPTTQQAAPVPPSTTTAAPTTPVPTTTATPASCNLPHQGDLVVRTVAPRVEPSAQLLGDVDLVHCAPALDFLAKAQPSGPGYCTTVGRQADNPNYNVDAVPAPPIPHTIAQTTSTLRPPSTFSARPSAHSVS